MALLTARLTARRFRVVGGELPEGFREIYRDRLNEFGFREPPIAGKEIVAGWTLVDDLTQSDFTDFNQWFIGGWVVFGLRIDKRVLPSKKFRAVLNRKCQDWCKDRDIDRCPASVRSDIKDALESEWLKKVMPRTQTHEIAWNLDSSMVYVSTQGDTACDVIRKRFFRTFGRKMIEFSPLDWIADDEVVGQICSLSPLSPPPQL